MTNYIYTSKKTGVAYILEGSNIIEGKTRYTLFSEEEQDRISVTESVLKRWYKKSVEVDFTNAEKKPEETPEQEPTIEEQAHFDGTASEKSPVNKEVNKAISYVNIPMEEFSKQFKNVSINPNRTKVYSSSFHPRKIIVLPNGDIQFKLRKVIYTLSI